MLSKRLQTVADMVTRGNIMADIGTDHGYVPIYLTKNNICPRAYAMDINKGPLQIAENNIKREGLSHKVSTIQSDGMERLHSEMVQTVVIAGMGGELITDILKRGDKIKGIQELILSPHRRTDLVRKYLIRSGWHISEEKMVLDFGKYYTIIKAVPRQTAVCDDYSEEEFFYGKQLLEQRDCVLKEYLEKEYEKFLQILNTMKKNKSNNINQIEKRLELNQKGRKRYDSSRNKRQSV